MNVEEGREYLATRADELDWRDAGIFVSVLLISAGAAFLYQQYEPGSDRGVELSGEVNASRNTQTIDFYNETAQLMVEQGDNATFYIDMDSDGSADITLDTVHDGEVRQEARILDYRSGAYLLEFTYSDNASKSGDEWLRPSRITLLQ